MNKIFVTLLGTGIAALILAVICGSWLFFQSWEEGKRLERQNRELTASLEASRIRLENFCEYPAEALCNLDERPGSVSEAMSSFSEQTTSLPEPAAPVHTSAAKEKNTDAPSQSAVQKNTVPMMQPSSPPTSNASSSDASDSQDTAATGKQQKPETGISSDQRTAPAVPMEKSGTSSRVQKKTWTSLDLKKNTMRLRIAGEGSSFTAHGLLLDNPLRYEVTIPGLWNINTKPLRTSIIREFHQHLTEDNTILVFMLASSPKYCEITQENRRTISIQIR